MLSKKAISINIVLSSAVLLMTGCSDRIQVPDGLGDPAKVGVETKSKFDATGKTSAKVKNNWLRSFHDSRLNRLAQEAIANNPDLRAASLTVAQAVAYTKLANAALQPIVGYNANISDTSAVSGFSSGGIGASWQPDVWGRVSAQVQSARSSQRSIEADYAFARQSLVADVARSWFVLIESTKQAQLATEIVKEYEGTLKIVKVKYEVGEVLRKDVSQARADVNTAKDSLIQAKNAVQKSSRALELLLGRYPGAKLATGVNLPRLSKFPSTGVPADVLQRRPDLIAEEEQLRSAFFATKDAELARLPTFNLSVGAGLNNIDHFIGLLAAGVVGPIYTGGAIEAQIEGANATQEKALASYESTILGAFRDVETTLADEKVLLARSKVLTLAVADYKIALEDTKTQYELGEIDLTLVQFQQRILDASRSTDLHVKSLLLQNRVDMYLSLGGGFDKEDAAGEVKRSIKADRKKEKEAS